MICPYCKEDIKEQKLFCDLCESRIDPTESLVNSKKSEELIAYCVILGLIVVWSILVGIYGTLPTEQFLGLGLAYVCVYYFFFRNKGISNTRELNTQLVLQDFCSISIVLFALTLVFIGSPLLFLRALGLKGYMWYERK